MADSVIANIVWHVGNEPAAKLCTIREVHFQQANGDTSTKINVRKWLLVQVAVDPPGSHHLDKGSG